MTHFPRTARFKYTAEADMSSTSGNPLAETMLQIYAEGVGYVLWNDQPLSKSPRTKVPELHAHAKGLTMFLANLGLSGVQVHAAGNQAVFTFCTRCITV